MILHRYLAKKYILFFAAVLTIFSIFICLIDLVEQLRRFGNDVNFQKIIELTASNAPATAYRTMPLIMILSSVWMFLSLARSSELVIMRSIGRSPVQFLLAPTFVALLIGIILVTVINPIVAATSKHFFNESDKISSRRNNDFSIGAEGLWLRDGDETRQTIMRAARSNSDGSILYDVSFLTISGSGLPIRRVDASSATLKTGSWLLLEAKIWPLNRDKNPELESFVQKFYTLETDITLEHIQNSFGNPITIAIWDLPQQIRHLQSSGYSARRHLVWQQMEIARPIFLTAMMLIGAAFSMGHIRFGGRGVSILIAVLLGFILFYLRNFAQILGENGRLPIVFAAWTPPIATLLIAIGIILQKEDG